METPRVTPPVSGGPLDEYGTHSDPWTKLDWTLAIIGGIALLFLLTFATSGMTSAFRNTAKRRRLLIICVVVQLAVIAGIVALIVL